MTQMSHLLRVHIIGLQTAGMSTRAVAREFNVHSSVNIVNRVPHGGGGVMLCTGISYGQQTQLHFIDVNLNAQRYRDEIAIHPHHFMFQHDNPRPHVARIAIPGR